MRKLKFRVWCPTSKHFSTQPWLSCDGLMMKWEHTSNESTLTDIRFDEYIVQQYTGMKDRNGKEIYEGDILKYEPLGATIYYEVFWDEMSAAWKNTKENGGNSGPWFDLYEVAGNIFENSELLKQ